MDDIVDNENYEELLKALMKMQSGEGDRCWNREARLWNEINVACSLLDCISKLTKDELVLISHHLDFNVVSFSNKQQLAESLTEAIIEGSHRIFSELDMEQYDLMKKIYRNNGWTDKISMSIEQVQYWRERGIIFSGARKERKLLVMPREIVSEFKRIDNEDLRKKIQRNSTWMQLSNGLLYYYGALDASQLNEMVAKLMKVEVDFLEFHKILSNTIEYYQEIQCKEDIYYHLTVRNPEKIRKQHNERPDLAFYPFSYEEIYQAGVRGFLEKNFAFKLFSKDILETYGLPDNEADDVVEECTNAIKEDVPLNNIMELIPYFIKIEDMETLKKFMAHVTFLQNNTRQWGIKGYTPQEIMLEEKKQEEQI